MHLTFLQVLKPFFCRGCTILYLSPCHGWLPYQTRNGGKLDLLIEDRCSTFLLYKYWWAFELVQKISWQIITIICCNDKILLVVMINTKNHFHFYPGRRLGGALGHKSFLAKIKPSPPTAFQVCVPTRPQTTSDHYELGEKRKIFVSLDIWLGQMFWYFYHFQGYFLQQRISGSELSESYIYPES